MVQPPFLVKECVRMKSGAKLMIICVISMPFCENDLLQSDKNYYFISPIVIDAVVGGKIGL